MRLACCSMFIVCFVGLFSGCADPVAPAAENQTDDAPVEMERVKAEAGVGKQGQVIGDKEGILRTPAKALFTAKQKIAFMKVEHALNLYEGLEGHKPKSHEEFMEKVIKFNNIELPELPEGQTYVWDPDESQLLVEKPKQLQDGPE